MGKEINLDSLDRTEDITVEEVRSLATFKDWSEEKILALIRTAKALTRTVYNNWSKGRKIGKEIALESNNQTDIKTAA